VVVHALPDLIPPGRLREYLDVCGVHDGVVLVRPDGHVAWRGHRLGPEALIEAVMELSGRR
jgi:hypothetical protein